MKLESTDAYQELDQLKEMLRRFRTSVLPEVT